MHKIGPYFPARAFEPSRAFTAWLDLYADGYPQPDKWGTEVLIEMHEKFLIKQAAAKERAASRQAA